MLTILHQCAYDTRMCRFSRGTLIVIFILSFLQNLTQVSAHELHPLRISELNWKAEGINRVLANSFDIQSGAPIIIWTDPGEVIKVDGHSCLAGPYFMFDIDDNYAFNINETVTVELLFDRTRSDGFIIGYDHATQAPVAKKVEFTEDDKSKWHRQTVTLEHAGFANRRLGAADLSVAALGAVLPYNPASDHEIVLCGIKIERSNTTAKAVDGYGELRLEIRDASGGELAPARVSIRGPDGRMPIPGDDALLTDRFTEHVRQVQVRRNFEYWPEEGGYAFYADGTYTSSLPSNTYEMIVVKGPEYKVVRRQFKIEAGKETKLFVHLQRWKDLPAGGWYSGDDHVHISRPEKENARILAHMRAEDIHLANLLQMANLRRSYYLQYAFGQAGQYQRGDYALASGQESPRTSQRGHTIGLNGAHFYSPVNYFLYQDTADLIHADGGLFGYAHVMVDALHASLGLAMDVPMGMVDFVEILQHEILGTEIFYDFLNLGFKLIPTAGSDFPYINLPGSERSYVHIEGKFTADAWYRNLGEGHTFVSNAPVLEFSIAGKTMGEEVQAKRGSRLKVSATVSINPDFDKPARLELVLHGAVIASVEARQDEQQLQLEYELSADKSVWLAVRAYGKLGALAHSAPIYVYVDGDRNFWNPALVPALADKYLGKIQTLLSTLPQRHEDIEKWDTGEIMGPLCQAQLPALSLWAEQAVDIYHTLKVRALNISN